MYLEGRLERERARETEGRRDISEPLVDSLSICDGQNGARLKLTARTQFRYPMWVSVSQQLGPSPAPVVGGILRVN